MSQLGTQTGYPRRVPRPRWTPPNDEIAAQIAETKALFRQWKDSEAAYKQSIAKLTDPEGADVPVAYMAEQLEIERKTVYRHTGRSMT